MQTEQTTGDLLTFENIYTRASRGKRFFNYLIDVVFLYILIFGVGVAILLISPETLDRIDDDSSFDLFGRLIFLILYALYMSAVESIFKGKSLGKLITGTKAVNLDGTPITTSKAFARGFSRAVPFCFISAFGAPCNPWQDKWTDTMVIDEKKSEISN